MGCGTSSGSSVPPTVPVHEGETDGPTADPALHESQIAIKNDSGRVLYAAVMDDINAQIVTQIRGSANIGIDGVGGAAGVVWDLARVTVQKKTLIAGSRNIFNINGECCSVWISDKDDFPVSSTPYSSMRIPKGHVQVIKEELFREVHTKKYQDFLSKPLSACSLVDIPGIGPASATKLEAAGCESVTRLKEIFVTSCSSSTDELVAWLTSQCGIQGCYATKAARALQVKVRANT
jgi:hypothetical protein